MVIRTDMKFLITGKKGLALALKEKIGASATCISQSDGYKIQDVLEWGPKFYHYDVLINCAHNEFDQVKVLEQFYYAWKDDSNKIIVNVGSISADYNRSEFTKEYEYLAYKFQKQALQSVYAKLTRLANCDIKLINPGAIDTAMVEHLTCQKMDPSHVADRILWMIENPDIKRLDLWQ